MFTCFLQLKFLFSFENCQNKVKDLIWRDSSWAWHPFEAIKAFHIFFQSKLTIRTLFLINFCSTKNFFTKNFRILCFNPSINLHAHTPRPWKPVYAFNWSPLAPFSRNHLEKVRLITHRRSSFAIIKPVDLNSSENFQMRWNKF